MIIWEFRKMPPWQRISKSRYFWCIRVTNSTSYYGNMAQFREFLKLIQRIIEKDYFVFYANFQYQSILKFENFHFYYHIFLFPLSSRFHWPSTWISTHSLVRCWLRYQRSTERREIFKSLNALSDRFHISRWVAQECLATSEQRLSLQFV